MKQRTANDSLRKILMNEGYGEVTMEGAERGGDKRAIIKGGGRRMQKQIRKGRSAIEDEK